MFRKNETIFPWNMGWYVALVVQLMISSWRPAGPIVSTVFTSSSEQGMPTSRSLILRQVGAASAGVKVVGLTVTPPASALLPASGEMITPPPPAPVGEEPPEPLFE